LILAFHVDTGVDVDPLVVQAAERAKGAIGSC
jgi:hypothetical protein